MSNDDLKGLEPKANKTNYVGSDSEEGRLQHAADNKRQIGVLSASMLIFNRVIGTGIFATPGSILALLGSPGLALIIWVVGSIIAAAGTAVYLEWGTGIPKNGGEKNYLEFIYRKPKFLVTGIYASYILLMGWASGNSVVFGEYILHAANTEVDRWNQRGIGLACITTAFLIHGCALKWGLRLQNPNNFKNAFEGTTGSAYGVVTALYNVIWSFVGYSNANYALSETRNPVRTLKIAAPTAIISVSIIYILVNIAYFAAVSKAEIIASERLVAASLFRNVMGPAAERAMSVFVALSAFGNVLSVIFSQGRLVQELGREGILPFSRLWASNRPFNAPLAGLFEHWVICVIVILAPPPGDAYNFILNLISYPLAIVNTFVAGGLVHLYLHGAKYNWNPPIKATLPVTVFFLLSNMYLVIAPFIAPDDPSQNQYKSMPYYIHCVVGIAILVAGSLNGLVQSWSSESSSVRRRSPSKFIFAPFLSVQCDPELAGLLLVRRRSPTDTHLCTVLQAFLGLQVFFYPQKISCLCPSLQVLQSFFGIVGLLLCTEDLPLKPISAGFASFLGTAGLLLSTEDLLPMPISAGLAILGLQVFYQVFYPQKIPCLHPSLQVLKSFLKL
ncbi:Amino acid/polyamine transporter I [Fusarium oxysporum f. sp. vasinfectum]|nr:Amino acid/polyamine transporter I [Fusarium oxysporum f. sp. vasinfectum]